MNRYKVWDPNNGDESDAKEIEASSIEYAASKYAEKYDSDNDYAFTTNDGVNLLVRKAGSEYVASVIAWGEQTVDYKARFLSERDFE